MQIKQKLTLMMLTLISIPLLVLALMIYMYSSSALVGKSKENIKQLAITEGKALDALIDAKKYQVQILASDERVIEVLEDTDVYSKKYKMQRVQELLKQLIIDEEDCYQSYIINQEGRVIVSSSNKSNIEENIDFNNLKRVLNGEIVFDKIIQDENVDYSINITVPIRDKEGNVIGAICKVLLNNSFRDFISVIELNQMGHAYILDKNGVIIAHPDKNRIGKVMEDKLVGNIVKANVTLSPMEGIVLKSTEDSAMQYVALYRVPEIDWTIGICRDINEIRRQAFMEFIMVICAVVVLVIGVSVMTVIVSRKVTRPIDELIGVMNQASEGKLDNYCTYESSDEFGELAKHYNNMIRKLGENRIERDYMLKRLTVAQDELKSNIEELIKSKEALSVSEERYRTTLDDIEETIWEHDTKTNEFLIIGKWKKFIEEHSEMKESSLIKINPKGIDAFSAVIEKESIEEFKKIILQCKQGKIIEFSKELRLNGIGWSLCKGKAVYNDNGEVIKIRGIMTDITNHKMSEEKVKQLAYFDVLTGCLNKQAFMVRFKESISNLPGGKKAALFFVDLDDFKKINDTMGHEIGDSLLNYVANMIKSHLPSDVLVSRFGGDEFAISKSNIADIEEVKIMAESILSIFNEKIEVDGHSIHITCSIGIALYPLDGSNCKTLLKNADTAMYKSKDQGKNKYSFYAKDMSKTLNRKLLVEGALREAVDGVKDLYLQYQPIVELNTGKTIGAEALIRLKNDELGFVSPGEFIPIAEETGLIVAVGDWVMEQALITLNEYRKQGYREFSININVSAVQIQNRNFMNKLKECIDKVGIDPRCIKIEVTETVLMQNLENSRIIFDEIKQMGIKLALDDFGTGYSSLNYLRNIPLDVLKIDKSFIDEVTVSHELSEIVDSIINMAHILGISVVAEGVETEEQLDLLREKGCDLIQGYVFSKPLMQEELTVRLEREKIV